VGKVMLFDCSCLGEDTVGHSEQVDCTPVSAHS